MVIFSNLICFDLVIKHIFERIKIQLLDQKRFSILDLLHQSKRLFKLVFPYTLHQLLKIYLVFVSFIFFGNLSDIFYHCFVPALPVKSEQLHLLLTFFYVFTIAALVFLDALDDVRVCQLRHFFSDSSSDSLLVFN